MPAQNEPSLDPRAAAYLEEQTEILRMMKPDLEEEQRPTIPLTWKQ